jgi:hypothetical protein
LRHADSHIHLDTAFDKRIAFIGIDGAVEDMYPIVLVSAFLKIWNKISRKEVDAVEMVSRA